MATNKELIERAEKWLAVEAYFEDMPPLAQTNAAVAVNLIRDLLAALRPDIEAVERDCRLKKALNQIHDICHDALCEPSLTEEELAEFHACRTGDCAHTKQTECDEELKKEGL